MEYEGWIVVRPGTRGRMSGQISAFGKATKGERTDRGPARLCEFVSPSLHDLSCCYLKHDHLDKNVGCCDLWVVFFPSPNSSPSSGWPSIGRTEEEDSLKSAHRLDFLIHSCESVLNFYAS